MLRFISKLFKYAIFAVLAAAGAAKFLLESNAEPDTEEVDLVSIFEGKTLISSADPFYGGKVLGMFSGTVIDLRKATPAPTGVDLDIAVCFGGVNLILPEGWRVRSEILSIFGGFLDATRTTADPNAPVVRLTGYAVGSGVRVTTRTSMEVVS